MKKNLFMVAAVALMVFTACNKQEINVEAGASVGTIEFVAGFDADTKTTLKAGKTEWVAGDEISINGVKFVAQNDGPTSTFLNAEEPAEDFGAPFTAVYPYGADGVPAAQTAYAGNFDPKAVVETATSDDHNLSFKNESSLLKFQVSAACKTVTLTSDTELATGSNTVTITGDFAAGTDYYAAVLPGTKTNFVVRLDGYLSKNAASVTVGNSTIADMKTLPAPKASTYKLMGIGGDWTNGKTFYKDIDCYVLKNVSITATTEFKFCQGSIWGRPITFEKGRWAYTYNFPHDNMSNISGTYDIWADPQNDAVCFVDVNGVKPEFNNANKLVHILYEATGNCGLYIKSPATTVNNYNSTGAWGNFQTVYMNKTANEAQNYCAFPLPSNVVGKSATFTIRVWGDKNKTYTMTITNDTPFWGNSDSGGSYTLSSRINIE